MVCNKKWWEGVIIAAILQPTHLLRTTLDALVRRHAMSVDANKDVPQSNIAVDKYTWTEA